MHPATCHLLLDCPRVSPGFGSRLDCRGRSKGLGQSKFFIKLFFQVLLVCNNIFLVWFFFLKLLYVFFRFKWYVILFFWYWFFLKLSFQVLLVCNNIFLVWFFFKNYFICFFRFGWYVILFFGTGDAFNRSQSSAGHLTNIKYTVVQLGATAILGCCKDYAYAISWVLVIRGTFQCESEINRVVDLRCRVKRVVKRVSCNVTEVESKGAEL